MKILGFLNNKFTKVEFPKKVSPEMVNSLRPFADRAKKTAIRNNMSPHTTDSFVPENPRGDGKIFLRMEDKGKSIAFIDMKEGLFTIGDKTNIGNKIAISNGNTSIVVNTNNGKVEDVFPPQRWTKSKIEKFLADIQGIINKFKFTDKT